MTDHILGPAGVLPPGEWAVGALVRLHSTPGMLVDRGLYGWHVAIPIQRGWRTAVMSARLSLDLTTGTLDFGTRALLALVAPEVEQPLTAPDWHRCWDGWELVLIDGVVARFINGMPDDEDEICAPLAADETNPRRALALALAAARNQSHTAHHAP